MVKVPSLNELDKMYKDLGGKGPAAGKEAQSQKKPKSKKGKAASPPPSVEAELPEREIYSEVHFFFRPNQVWQHVLQDAKVEANVRGSNVLVFAHNHVRSEFCNHLCRQVTND